MEITQSVNSGSIRSFYSILHAWIKSIEKYSCYFKFNDNPWWYNERATLSCLAAAAWINDGVALEEYCTIKGKHSNPKSGRCDLFLGIGDESFDCEAKQVWCAIGRTAGSGISIAEAGLDDACIDARKLKKEKTRRLGLCFAVPYLPIRDKDFIEEQLKLWLRDLQEIDYSCIAWAFPEKSRYSLYRGEYYPGVVLMVKEVFRQRC